jgi:Fe-S cluster assembly scaffold protein SufB
VIKLLIQTYPVVHLKKNARAYLVTISASSGKGVYDLGSKAILHDSGSSTEIISRTIARDESKVYARSEIETYDADTKGHIECLGLLLSEKALISSIPIITSGKPGAILTHEAAIGMIARQELEYLMSKGFTEDEARAVLIRGFMNVDAPGIPFIVRREIDRILDLVTKYAVG